MLRSAHYRTSPSQASAVPTAGDSAGIPICSPATTNWFRSPCNLVVCFERLYCLSARVPWITFVSSSPFSSPHSHSSVTTRPVRLLLPAAGGSGALPLATQELGPAQADRRLQGVPRLPRLLLSRHPGPARGPQDVTGRGWFQLLMKAAETRPRHT